MRASWPTTLLFAVDFLDELISGVPSLGAPQIRASLGLGYASLSLALMTAPLSLGLLVEPLLLAWSRARPRGPLVAAGLAAMALGSVLAACAPGAVTLALSLALLYVGSGLACTLAQTALMDGDPDRREQRMARWTLMGALGDAAAPPLFVLLDGAGLGYRAAFVSCAALCVLHAIVLWRRRAHLGVDMDGDATAAPPPRLRRLLSDALANRVLLAWTAGELVCLLLDEVLFTFAALRMREQLGFDAAALGAVLLACSIGAALGLALAERLLARVEPLRLLALSCLLCLVAYAFWLCAETPATSAALMFLVGVSVGPQYPIAKAQAYRAAPGASIVVALLGSLLQPVSLALPFVIGLCADHLGLGVALASLAVQPLVLLLLALAPPRRIP